MVERSEGLIYVRRDVELLQIAPKIDEKRVTSQEKCVSLSNLEVPQTSSNRSDGSLKNLTQSFSHVVGRNPRQQEKRVDFDVGYNRML